jgi:hypothetical protein
MRDHRGTDRATSPSIMTQQHPEPHASTRRFAVFSWVVLISGLVAAGLVAWWQPMAPSADWLWIGALLAVGFLLAEQLAVNIDVRGGVSWTISFTEIPLVIGLFVAPFQVVLAAHLIAGVGTFLARRVQDRIVYNSGVFVIEIASAFAVATLINTTLGGIGPGWLGVLAGALAAPLSSTLLALVAADAGQRRRPVGLPDPGSRCGERVGRRRGLPGGDPCGGRLAAGAGGVRRAVRALPRLRRADPRAARSRGTVRSEPGGCSLRPSGGRAPGDRCGR